ncbi:glycosyltransferase family 1 protein [Paenibacillus psychroresistens]|uniref:Glycosyltransferase family 1 protein n=1 Tax=Paenibacillus psychroresistens TaxID=1778678 RepID=A0A6B8RJ03_9BACL|nr:glycosyltransferase family 4 protein [Paenibacillus psychroresistens]QGQ95562.1 glycosyltransferase family 1 protein [Paenibacillus psychroresistens]
MHILMIAPEQVPIPGSGSVEICMLAIAKELVKQHKVTIISRQYKGCKNIVSLDNLTIIRVPAISSNKYITAVLHYIKGKHYDFIQVDNRPIYMAKVKKAKPKTPVALFLHSMTFVPRTLEIASCLHKADLIIANSSSLKNNLARIFPNQNHKIHIVHLGVDVSRFKPLTNTQKNAYRSKQQLGSSFLLLFSGRVVPRKGVAELIEATRLVRTQIPDTKLIIVGAGNTTYIRKLNSIAKKRNIPVYFTGLVSHKSIHNIYRLVDCFICPSQKHEAFGLVNIEAMASGIPVVASDIGGIKEIIKHGQNGYLVKDYKNPQSFAHYIIKIGQNKLLADNMAQQGRLMAVNQFSWSHTAARLMAIYKKSSRE